MLCTIVLCDANSLCIRTCSSVCAPLALAMFAMIISPDIPTGAGFSVVGYVTGLYWATYCQEAEGSVLSLKCALNCPN